jgi:DNA recombination protein RmuC
MTELLLCAVAALAVVVLILQILLLRRKASIDPAPIQQIFESVEKSYERTERTVKDEISMNRKEMAAASQQSREELGSTLKGMGDTLNQQLATLTQTNDQKLEKMRETIEQRLQLIQEESTKKLEQVRQDSQTAGKTLRDEVAAAIKSFTESLTLNIGDMSRSQTERLTAFGERLQKLTETNEQKLEVLKVAVEGKLKEIQQDNAKQLDQMRATVDEKLQGTLEKRLGESFKQVSERLEQVYKGLGEMQVLATGVGDLKRVLTNVKTRGTWGEVQLGAMLEQVLTPEQYDRNVAVKSGGERVEFAVKLPGRTDDKEDIVWLPIDAKFPVEDYQRLVDAQEKADGDLADDAVKKLESRIKQCAADICEKYISPPKTTDFGILFLPTEGLFAEVIRRPDLTAYIQRECRVVVAGPTTLWSILNSLQMGFRTLAIEKRSSEVWNLLAAVKTEWTRYGEVLGKVQKKLHEASETIEKAQTRNRAIGRKLKDVQTLPVDEAKMVLMVEGDVDGFAADAEEGEEGH